MANAKQVRILNGDSSHVDHYIDAANYFTLAGGLYKTSSNNKECVMKGGISLCGECENE